MIECEVCKSCDFTTATVKENIRIAICNECDSIYELDENGLPVLGHDPNDMEYFAKLDSLFGNWDNLKNMTDVEHFVYFEKPKN